MDQLIEFDFTWFQSFSTGCKAPTSTILASGAFEGGHNLPGTFSTSPDHFEYSATLQCLFCCIHIPFVLQKCFLLSLLIKAFWKEEAEWFAGLLEAKLERQNGSGIRVAEHRLAALVRRVTHESVPWQSGRIKKQSSSFFVCHNAF